MLVSGVVLWLVWPHPRPETVPAPPLVTTSNPASPQPPAAPQQAPAWQARVQPAQPPSPPPLSRGRKPRRRRRLSQRRKRFAGTLPADAAGLAAGAQSAGAQSACARSAGARPGQPDPAGATCPRPVCLRLVRLRGFAGAEPAGASRRPALPASPAPIPVEVADEAQIRTHVPTGLTVFRFAANPSIVVLDFASLREQGLMLNRIAALTEKAATPHDRVLNDTELDAAISAGGDTVETFYYGHDYSAAEIAHFFSLAAQEGIRLDPEEEKLHRLLTQLGWLAPGVQAGLISVPRAGANAAVTQAARSAILRHELAHGEYFSSPAYAAYVHQFWQHELSHVERDDVRRFLASEEYDPRAEELVENEMQAYLMFTRDSEFFTPAKVGMTPSRLFELQASFHRNMPPGWLRDLLGQTLVAARSPY